MTREYKVWTDKEIKKLLCEIEKCTPMKIIARNHNRKIRNVSVKIKRLGLEYNYRGNTDYISVSELATILNVPRQSVGKWIRDGKLKATRNGRYKLISDQNMMNFLRDNQDLWSANNIIIKEYFDNIKWFDKKLESEDEKFIKRHLSQKPWSGIDEQRLIAWKKAGKTNEWIADRLGKTKGSVSRKYCYMMKKGRFYEEKV